MKEIREKLMEYGKEQGFAHMAFMPVKDLVFVEEYRQYCEENRCGNYNKIPNCPPTCGSFSKLKEDAQQYTTAFVMQTICQVEDFGDEKAFKAMKQVHNRMTKAVVDAMDAQGVKGLTMSAGPTKESSCMSAYCVDASSMADACGMQYWMGDNKVAFFSQFLFCE